MEDVVDMLRGAAEPFGDFPRGVALVVKTEDQRRTGPLIDFGFWKHNLQFRTLRRGMQAPNKGLQTFPPWW